MLKKSIGLAIAWLAAGGLAQASALPVPKAGYSATRVIETGTHTMQQQVWVSGLKERMETRMEGVQMVMIVRRDKALAWMLMPQMSMYQEMDLKTAGARMPASPPDDVEITEVGSENIEGLATTKYRMSLKDQSADGFIWISGDGIPVKMDLLARDGGDETRVTMRLHDLKLGKQDAALFELPAGLRQMPSMGGMSGR